MADIYSLFSGAPDATQQAQALAEALRRRRENAAFNRGVGNFAMLTGDRVLSEFGRNQLQQAGQGDADAGRMEGMLSQAGGQLAGRQLQEALAKRQDAFQAGQAGLQRGLQRELAGITDARERAKMEAAAEAARIKAGADKVKETREGATGLRKEFYANPEVKDYQMLSSAYDKLQTSSKTPGRAADLAVIFNFMQMLDPGVAVMEGDVRNVTNVSGQMDNAINLYRQIFNGDKLTPAGRASIMQQANALHGTARRRYDALAKEFTDLAVRSGFSPGDVIFTPPSGLEAPAEKPGTPPGSINLEPRAAGGPAPAAMSAEEAEALQWAREHPDDEDAKRILQELNKGR